MPGSGVDLRPLTAEDWNKVSVALQRGDAFDGATGKRLSEDRQAELAATFSMQIGPKQPDFLKALGEAATRLLKVCKKS